MVVIPSSGVTSLISPNLWSLTFLTSFSIKHTIVVRSFVQSNIGTSIFFCHSSVHVVDVHQISFAKNSSACNEVVAKCKWVFIFLILGHVQISRHLCDVLSSQHLFILVFEKQKALGKHWEITGCKPEGGRGLGKRGLVGGCQVMIGLRDFKPGHTLQYFA